MKLCSIKDAVDFFTPLVICMGLAGAAAAQPVPLQPASPQENPAPAADNSSDNPQSDDISVGELAEIDTGAAGTLTPETGGFPRNMWVGTSRALVEQLLPHVPITTPSPTLQKLARKLLLSAADLPLGKPGAVQLLGLRAGLLALMGEFDAVTQLASYAGNATNDENLLKARSDSLLAVNDLDQACQIATPLVKKSMDVYWLKLSGFCQIRRSDLTAAQLTLSLLNEQDDADTATQTMLAALIDKGSAPPKSLKNPSALQLAMIRMASWPLPKNTVETAQTAALKILARTPEIEMDVRIAAAERAAELGAIGYSELEEIYAAREFTVAERADAVNAATQPGPRTNALMYQSVRQQDTNAGRATAIGVAWAAARAGNSFTAVARANIAATRDVIPVPELLGMADNAGRALLTAGETATATRWFDMARNLVITGNENAAKVKHSLWPLVRLANGLDTLPHDPAEMESWFESLPPEVRQKHGLLMFAMLQALGFEIPPEIPGKLSIKPMFESREMLSVPLLISLQDAGRQRRLGETVLISLISLDQRLSDPFLINQVLVALVNLGMQDEARMLAVEAALQAGI